MPEYNYTDTWIEVTEPVVSYGSEKGINAITYKIIGCCFEVYNILGRGFSEVIYKDALEYELKRKGLSYTHEEKFEIKYKEITLPHYYFSGFIIENSVILEIKATEGINDGNIKQVLNYLAASGHEIGLLINFGESSLKYKRVILN